MSNPSRYHLELEAVLPDSSSELVLEEPMEDRLLQVESRLEMKKEKVEAKEVGEVDMHLES